MNEEDQLQQIRDSRNTLASHPTGRMLVSRYVRHIDALLAEVERLQARLRDTIESRESFIRHATLAAKERYEKAEAQNAAMRPIVQAVADGRVGLIGPLEIESGIIPSKIDADDLRDKARAILATESEAEQ